MDVCNLATPTPPAVVRVLIRVRVGKVLHGDTVVASLIVVCLDEDNMVT